MPAHRGIAWCVAFSADGTQLASGGGEARTSDQEVIIWDVETGRRQRSFPHLEGGARALALSPDGRKIAAAIGKRVRVWDARTEEEIVVLEGHEANVTGLAFHRDSLQLLSCGEDMTVRAWDVTTGRLGNTLWGHKSLVLSVTYSPDGTRAASSSIDRTVRVWDIQAGQELFALRGHTGYVKKLVFSFDGRILYSCDHNGFVRAWDGTPVAGEDP
jgi:WD40 repeat protein